MFHLFSLFEDFISSDDEVFLFGGLRGFYREDFPRD
jgi:hypothetical protein